jgi:hypothetical protein
LIRPGKFVYAENIPKARTAMPEAADRWTIKTANAKASGQGARHHESTNECHELKRRYRELKQSFHDRGGSR